MRAALLIVWLAASWAAGQTPPVAAQLAEIAGGPDPSGQNYAWTITNLHRSLHIVRVEFPHFHAHRFDPPPGWRAESTNLRIAGSRDEPGVCKAWVERPGDGIAPGARATLGIGISREGTARGTGTITLTFADGTQTAIADVPLPVAPSWLDQNLMVIGMLVLLVGAVVFHRRRRTPRAPAAPGIESAP